MKNLLVTGGAGYIGSNIVKVLIDKGYKVVILDSLVTGKEKLIHPDAAFCNVDLLDLEAVRKIFAENTIDTVLHFAGYSLVGESQKDPQKYYENNVLGGLILLRVMEEFECKKIIFSSSAAVYGVPRYIPIDEKHQLKPINVYGETKVLFEKMLEYYSGKNELKYLSLRYFNAGGASDCGKYGEMHDPETHLIPNVLKAILAGEPVNVFGDDYETEDGTCVRDYVHVVDLAEAHLKGVEYLDHEESTSEIINLGSGKGFSVKQILDACGKVTGKDVKVVVAEKRAGDPPVLIAGFDKAKSVLGWSPARSVYDIVESAWKFESGQAKPKF